MRRRFLALLLFSVTGSLLSSPLFSQRSWEKGYHLTIKNFTPRDYKALPQNWAVTQSREGILFFGNNSGILEFDGFNFRFHSVKDQVVRSLDAGPDGIIYVGAENDFGLLRPDPYGALQYHSLLPFLDSADREEPGNIFTTLVYDHHIYFLSPYRIYRWDGHHIHTWRTDKEYYNAFRVLDSLYIQELGRGLEVVRGDTMLLIPDGERFSETGIAGMLPAPREGILIITENDGIFHYRFRSPIRPIIRRFNAIDNLLKEKKINCAVAINRHQFALGTEGSGAVIFDQSNDRVDFINFTTGLRDEIVHAMTLDSLGNLWMALNNGIAMTPANAAVTYFGPTSGLRETVEDITRFAGKIIVATHTGCYYLTKYQLNPELPWFVNNPIYTRPGFLQIKGTDQYAFALEHVTLPSGKVLLVAMDNCVLQISPSFNSRIVTQSLPWDIHQQHSYPKRIIVANEGSVETLLNDHGKWIPEGIIPGIEEDCRVIAEDPEGNVWVGANRYGILYKLRFSGEGTSRKVKIQRFDTVNGLPSEAVYPYFSGEGMLFGTGRGLYRFDGYRFFPDTTIEESFHNTKRTIHRISEDRKGKIWLATYLNDQKIYETGYLLKDNQGLQHWISKPFLSFSKSVIHAIYHDTGGITWLGGPNGLYQYDPSIKQDYNIDFFTYLRSVTAGSDSILFKGTFTNEQGNPVLAQLPEKQPVLPYSMNSLTFEYSAPLNEDGTAPLFSYYLEGFDKGWSSWSGKNIQGYTNLREGAYVFHVKAKNLYNNIGHEATYAFSILPPWYRTFWAYILFVILAIIVVYLIVFFYTRNLRQIISERTAEIRAQKEELEQKNKDILDSIHYAQRIQAALLPPADYLDTLFPDRFILYMPRDIVSGDFYWVAENNGKLFSATADCTGHGVPGAFMSMLGMAFLSEIITKEASLTPAEILYQLRQRVIKSLHQSGEAGKSQDGMDMAFFSLDPEKMTLTFAGANLPLLHIHNSELTQLKPDKMPIGISRKKAPFNDQTIPLQKGDIIYTFSDGYADQFGGPENKKFLIRNLRNKLLEIHWLPMAEQQEILHQTIIAWIGPGGTQIDDILVVGIRI